MAGAYLSQFDAVTQITQGMSGDEKYLVEKNGQRFLLRISPEQQYAIKEREYHRLSRLHQAGLPVPQCISFGKDPQTGKVFTLLSWIEGQEAEQILPKLSSEKQYRYGLLAGNILRKIHQFSETEEPAENWYDRYFSVIEPRLAAFQKEGILFEGSEKVLNFIEENKALLCSRPQCYHHSDYHTGNLIIHDGELYVIDWHTVDFDNIGDPWYEFNRIATELPMFAKGQIDGYFEQQVPEAFWRLFALYFSASAITSIVWAKHWAPKELDYIMDLNRRVVAMFDGMENPIPSWYRE